MPIRTIAVERYVTPLREGGSLPAIVEGNDQGMYVLKFRGAGQGSRVLIAELLAGEFARAAGLPIPELVFADLDIDLARTEPDPEVQSLIRASGGLNIAIDYLPGSVTFDPIAHNVDPLLASKIVWFDAFITNVDRTVRNANMLIWHGRLNLIDHGAALYFHYDWANAKDKAVSPFALIKDHVLLKRADQLAAAESEMKGKITPELIRKVVAEIPDTWLEASSTFASTKEHRDAYIQYFEARLAASNVFLKEAQRARESHV